MLKKYFVASVMAITISFSLATAETTIAPKPQNEPKVARNDIQLTVSRYAFIYGVDEDLLNEVIHCESTHNPNAVNNTDREYSVGLVQINLRAHPNISEKQAKDIDFAVKFLAENISKGRGSMWSCYKRS